MRIHPVGFTRQMDEYMAASDLLISKPGGLTTSEAMARGLPMCVVNPIPGQEERNSDHLLEAGGGDQVQQSADAGVEGAGVAAGPGAAGGDAQEGAGVWQAIGGADDCGGIVGVETIGCSISDFVCLVAARCLRISIWQRWIASPSTPRSWAAEPASEACEFPCPSLSSRSPMARRRMTFWLISQILKRAMSNRHWNMWRGWRRKKYEPHHEIPWRYGRILPRDRMASIFGTRCDAPAG